MRRYPLASIPMNELPKVLLLSCLIRHQLFDYQWRIAIGHPGTRVKEVDIWLEVRALIETGKLKNEPQYLLDLFGELEGKNEPNCQKYQQGKSILELDGGEFVESGVECIATRVGAFEKLNPMDRLLASPATSDTHDAKKYYNLRDLANYDDLDGGIAPLVYTLNRFPSVVTVSSCAGHWLWPRNRRPFIAFIANLNDVKGITEIMDFCRLDEWELSGSVWNGCPVSCPVIIWKLAQWGTVPGCDSLRMMNDALNHFFEMGGRVEKMYGGKPPRAAADKDDGGSR